jgi:hypothetical protein
VGRFFCDKSTQGFLILSITHLPNSHAHCLPLSIDIPRRRSCLSVICSQKFPPRTPSENTPFLNLTRQDGQNHCDFFGGKLPRPTQKRWNHSILQVYHSSGLVSAGNLKTKQCLPRCHRQSLCHRLSGCRYSRASRRTLEWSLVWFLRTW